VTERCESSTVATIDRIVDAWLGADALDEAAVAASEKDAKIALLGTVDPEGLPHLTLITSIQARSPTELMFGQFTEGSSKRHVKENPRTGFLLMSAAREVWRGKARWKGEAKRGRDYELYNEKPMFRYNAYFGIHTVRYLHIVEVVDKRTVWVPQLLAGQAATAYAKCLARSQRGSDTRVLTPWAESHVSKAKTLKFLAYTGADGYPEILPPIACRAIDDRRLAFSPIGNRRELEHVEQGCCVAVFALNLAMESVLIRGRFAGYRDHGGVRTGRIDIDWVYNSMPPKQGRIYPPEPLEPVTSF